jgi:hypothetical protein
MACGDREAKYWMEHQAGFRTDVNFLTSGTIAGAARSRPSASIGKRSVGDQGTAPISDASIKLTPLLVMLPKDPLNLGSA